MKKLAILVMMFACSVTHAETRQWVTLTAQTLDLENEIDHNDILEEKSNGVGIAIGALYQIDPSWSLGMAVEYNENEDTDLTSGNDNILTFYFADIQYRLSTDWFIKGRMGLSAYDASDTTNNTAYGWDLGGIVGYHINDQFSVHLSADHYFDLSLDNDRLESGSTRPDFFISGTKLGVGVGYSF